MNVLFISFHRIGTIEPPKKASDLGLVTIASSVSKPDLIQQAKSFLGEGNYVVAYLPANDTGLAEELAEIASTHPDHIRFVTCTCNIESKMHTFFDRGIELGKFCYITHGCGGVGGMAKVAQFVRANGKLPPMTLKLDRYD